MSLKDNRDTVVANIALQVVSLALILYVPNKLGVIEYGQVTFVTTLLSWQTFADFGISFVYGRKMPAVNGRNDADEIALWNSSTIRFRLYTSLLFGILVATIYGVKYGEVVNSLLLIPVAPLSTIGAFYTARYIAQRNYATPRDFSIFQSIFRLLIIAFVAIAGLSGWFWGQMLSLAAFAVIRDFRLKIASDWKLRTRIEWPLIRANLGEAIVLGLATTLWMQLLYSGRLFASFLYPDAIVGQYGVAGAAYQVIASLIISAFVPQTVKGYQYLEEGREKAVTYILDVIYRILPLMVLVASLGAYLLPYVLRVVFPDYHIESMLVTPLMLSLISFPLIVSLGTLLVGIGRSRLCLAVIMFWLLADALLVSLITPHYGFTGAAIAQFITLSLYSLSLLGLVMVYFWRDMKTKSQAYLSALIVTGTMVAFFII